MIEIKAMDIRRFENAQQMDLPMGEPEIKWSSKGTFDSGQLDRSSERQESNSVSYEGGKWYVNGKESNIKYVEIIIGQEWSHLRKTDSIFKKITDKYENSKRNNLN